MNPAKKFINLKESNLKGEPLYQSILEILTTFCFHPRLSKLIEVCLPKINLRINAALLEGRGLEKLGRQTRKIIEQCQAEIADDEQTFVKLKKKDDEIYVVEACMVMLLFLRRDLPNVDIYPDLASFVRDFPAFRGLTGLELNKLFHFANFMKYAVLVIKAKGNKTHLLNLIGWLTEGQAARYVTGGGSSPATNNRVAIYEYFGGA
jgi:hypothetical protein